jgi:outer membrane protein
MNRWTMKMILAQGALMLMMIAGPVVAQDLKIGFVNIGRLINESPQATEAMESLQEEFAPRQREIIAMQNDFKEKQAQLERDREVMGAEERQNLDREIRKEERDLTRSQQEFTEDINLRRNESLGKLQRELLQQVQVFAGQENYDLVLSSDGVLFASPVIDVTEQVLAGLKESFGTPAGGN